MNNNIVTDTGMESGKLPTITDANRQDVIKCLRASWPLWDDFTKQATKHAIGTYVSTDTRTFGEALESMSNENLSTFLYDVWDNGDLKVTSTVMQ